MNTTIFLGPGALKTLYCSICLKRKAITISKTNWTEEVLICKPCLLFLQDSEEEIQKYLESKGIRLLGALPLLNQILEVLRK